MGFATAGALRWRWNTQAEGNRPVIDQADLHMGAKTTGGYFTDFTPGASQQVIKQPSSFCRFSCRGEAGTVAAIGVGSQRKLGNQHELAA